jgi:hypothetical protein
VFWGQLGPKNIVNLCARPIRDGKPAAPVAVLAESEGSDSFAHAGTDAAGRVWVVWQSLRRGAADVYARFFDPKDARWSPEIAVTSDDAGDWEPRVAFDGKDGAWVVYDSSRGDEYNVYAAHVGLDGKVETKQITIRRSTRRASRWRPTAARGCGSPSNAASSAGARTSAGTITRKG